MRLLEWGLFIKGRECLKRDLLHFPFFVYELTLVMDRGNSDVGKKGLVFKRRGFGLTCRGQGDDEKKTLKQTIEMPWIEPLSTLFSFIHLSV